MTTRRIALDTSGEVPAGEVHLLPCHIRHDGPASVSQFFQSEHVPTTASLDSSDNTDALPTVTGDRIAYFRGRELHGTTTRLPEPYIGRVFQPGPTQTVPVQHSHDSVGGSRDIYGQEESLEPPAMEELSRWRAQHEFDALVEYGHNAKIQSKLAEWLALSKVIHGVDEGSNITETVIVPEQRKLGEEVNFAMLQDAVTQTQIMVNDA